MCVHFRGGASGYVQRREALPAWAVITRLCPEGDSQAGAGLHHVAQD